MDASKKLTLAFTSDAVPGVTSDNNQIWTEPDDCKVYLLNRVSEGSPLLTLASDLKLSAGQPLPLFGLTLASFVRAYNFLTSSAVPGVTADAVPGVTADTVPGEEGVEIDGELEELIRVIDSIIMPRHALIWSRYYYYCKTKGLPVSRSLLKQLLDLQFQEDIPKGILMTDLPSYQVLVEMDDPSLVPFQLLSKTIVGHSFVSDVGLHAIALNPYDLSFNNIALQVDLESIRNRQAAKKFLRELRSSLKLRQVSGEGASDSYRKTSGMRGRAGTARP